MKKQTVHTVESLKERTVEIGECWEWQGYITNNTPYVYSEGKMQPVRRVFSQLIYRPSKHAAFYGVNCKNLACVCPDHIKPLTQKQHMAAMQKNSRKSLTRAAKIQIYKRANSAKLDANKADYIRNSDENSRALAAKFGVSKSVICKVRAGKAWVNLAGNPFAGLMR